MWPDYDKTPLVIEEDVVFNVYDDWTAQQIGTFFNREDAEMFAKAYMKRGKKLAEKDLNK